MSTAGLRLWDPNGVLMVDTTSAVTVILGYVAIGGNATASGSLVDVNINLGIPFSIITSFTAAVASDYRPEITFSGSTISWTFVGSPLYFTGIYPACVFIYGVK